MQPNRVGEIYEFDSFRLSTVSWTLEYKGKVLRLARLDFLLLLAFLRQPFSFLEESALAPQLWPEDHNGDYHPLREHVCRVNKALKVGTGGSRMIRYSRGQGYIFLRHVRRSVI